MKEAFPYILTLLGAVFVIALYWYRDGDRKAKRIDGLEWEHLLKDSERPQNEND